MVARHTGDDLDLVVGKSCKLGISDQIVGMTMVLFVGDEEAEFMEHSRCFQVFSLALSQRVERFHLIEKRKCQACDLMSVDFFILKSLCKMQNALAPNILQMM